jgi:hypothetical protein
MAILRFCRTRKESVLPHYGYYARTVMDTFFGYDMHNHREGKNRAPGGSCGHLNHNVILCAHISVRGRHPLEPDRVFFYSTGARGAGASSQCCEATK